MSFGEIAWRCSAKAGELHERALSRFRTRPPDWDRVLARGERTAVSSSPVLGAALRLGPLPLAAGQAAAWKPRLIGQADRILQHRFDLFDLEGVFLGDEIDWNYEFKTHKRSPMRSASTIDYRDYAETGDCKFVWEPSRHYQLAVLGRAFRLTGDERYADETVSQIESWIRRCPCGMGMQWRSPLELAIRLINWVWALEFIRGSRALTDERIRQIVPVAWRHLSDIARKYSRFSSANNHAIGEAAGVFIGATYFSGLRLAEGWRHESRAILEREILRQTFPDGGTREQATGYHLFVLQFFVLADAVARFSGEAFSTRFRERLERMFDFAHALAEGGTAMPMIGDSDDGYVVDFGDRDEELRAWMAIGAILFQRADFKRLAGRFSETAFWLLGPESEETFDRIHTLAEDSRLRPRSLPESGYHLLRRGAADAGDCVSVAFDCGALGFLSIAAHGHADALSLVLRVGGVDLLVDPGTYDYFTYPRWREYFRSTRAHNTIVIDDCDQSERLGPFLWGRRAEARLIEWAPTDQGGRVVAEHNGYARLPDPVIHRRTVSLDEGHPTLEVTDEIDAAAKHAVTQFWHFSEHCRVAREAPNRVRADFGAGAITLILDPQLTAETYVGSEDPIAGWVSRGYHRKAPAMTVAGRARIHGRARFVTRIDIRPRSSDEA